MKTGKSMILAAFATTAALAGCPSEPEYPVQPSNTVVVPPPPASTPAPTATVPAPTGGCDALSQGQFMTIFTARAPAEAAGMQAEGGTVCGTVPEGGTVQGASFFLEQTKCYTVLANGLPNVSEVDVSLVIDATAVGMIPALAAMAATPLAVDSTTGAMAVIGGKPCYKWALPIPAPVKVVVKARQGAGAIGAQVYSKKSM